MSKHLALDLRSLSDSGATDHPQSVMKALSISYQHATPQSLYDAWWFWNCENAPTELPEYLTPLNVDPFDVVGHGLTLADAFRISIRRDACYAPASPGEDE